MMGAKMSLRRISALIKKECYQIVRDPSSLLICIVLPSILMFIYGVGVSLDLDHLRIGLVLEDTSPEATSFSRAIMSSRYFDVTIGGSVEELQLPMIRGSIRGIVVIPSYFTEFLYRPHVKAPIQIIADGSEPNTANFVRGYVSDTFETWKKISSISEGTDFSSLIESDPRFWYNPELESRAFLIPGSLAIIMALVGTLLTALVVAREWERGTMEALLATPVTIWELLLGKITPYFFLALMTMGFCCAIALFIYQIPFRGSWFALFTLSATFLVTALAQGLLISTAAKNQFVAGQISMSTAFLPAFMLSGFIFEISSMPDAIQYFTYLLSARYFVGAMATLFLAGDVWTLFIRDIGMMLMIGVVFLAIIARMSTKRLE